MGDRNLHIGILGGGLAGTFLAARLLEEGCRVSLIDAQDPSSSSRVAAGLYNVITGRFGSKTWMAESFLAGLKDFFDYPSYTFLREYLHELPIYRPFKEPGEFNKWTGRIDDPAYSSLVRFQETPVFPDQIHNPLGGIWVEGCGWLDTRNFLEHLTGYLSKQRGLKLFRQSVPSEAVDPSKASLKLASEELHFDRLVSCEGYHAFSRPYVSPVKIVPNKGELLECEIPNLSFPGVLSRKVYLIPLGGTRYLVGSTYQNQFDSLEPTQVGKETIVEWLEKAIKVPFSIVGQRAGVRPTTPNRRPIVGQHPHYPNFFLLNGLGTKGVLQAPYFSKVLVKLILGESPIIPPEANILRFF